jgi:hypothetical protein
MAGKRPSLPAAKAVLFERVACRKPSYNMISDNGPQYASWEFIKFSKFMILRMSPAAPDILKVTVKPRGQ